MKKLINLFLLVMLVSTNILTPFSYAEFNSPESDSPKLEANPVVYTETLDDEWTDQDQNLTNQDGIWVEQEQFWEAGEEKELWNDDIPYETQVENNDWWKTDIQENSTSWSNQKTLWFRKGDTLTTADITTVTVIYNANGWYFKNNASEKIVTYQKDDNTNKYVASENIQFPNKAANWDKKYMFAWWYLESWESTNQTNEWYTQDVELEAVWLWNTKTVYAKWLPFEDLPIVIGWKTVATIMDRNLWAADVAEWTYYVEAEWYVYSEGNQEDSSKLWYYYQWWNNYWFRNKWTGLPYSDLTNSNYDNRVDVSGYAPNNYYSNSTYKKVEGTPGTWMKENNPNLWWWDKSENPDTDKQWPCPSWYHVPDKWEWQALIDIFKSENSRDSEYCNDFNKSEPWKCFAAKFKLPFAGSRRSDETNIQRQGIHGNYWSSSNQDRPYSIFFYSNINSPDKASSAYGYSVRCFKDSLPNTLTLILDDYNSQNFNLRWRESAKEKVDSLDLKKEWKFILWWFKDREFTDERDFNKNLVTEDTTLYAKWVEWWIEYLENLWLVKVYAWDNVYYVKDRNEWVDNDVDIKWITNAMIKCIEDNTACSEEEKNNYAKILNWNFYYWWNNSGVDVKDLVVNWEWKVDTSSLPEWFNWSDFDNIWWSEGWDDSPCKSSNWEYLPTITDWMNVTKIQNGIYWYSEFSCEIWEGIVCSVDGDNVPKFMIDSMKSRITSVGWSFMEDDFFLDTYGYNYSWASKDKDWNAWYHVTYGLWGWSVDLVKADFQNMAMPVRCFVDPDSLIEVKFETNWWSEVKNQILTAWKFVENPENPTFEWKVFEGWYKDELLTQEYDFSEPIESDLILYAKWTPCRDWFIVRDNQCVPEDSEWIFYKDWYIKISNWDKTLYVKDRNQWAEMTGVSLMFKFYSEVYWIVYDLTENKWYSEEEAMNSKEFLDAVSIFLWKTVTSADQAEEEIMRLMEEYPYGDERSFWNYYFRWNNTGVSYNDLSFTVDENDNKIINMESSKFSEWFLSWWKLWTEEWNRWKKWNTDNPCNIASWEYLPTTEDWIELMEIYANINNGGLSRYDEGGVKITYLDEELLMYKIYWLIADMLLPIWWYIEFKECDSGDLSSCKSAELDQEIPYYPTAESDTLWIFIWYAIQYLTDFENDEAQEIIQEMNNIAMPVRCFMKVHKVSFDSNWWSDIVTKEIVSNQTIEELPTPTKNWEIFGWWYTDSELTNVFTSSTPVTSDLTLYAKWTQWQTSTSSYSWWWGGWKRITKTDIKEHNVSNEKDSTQEETMWIENTKTSMDSSPSVQNDSNTQRQNNSSESANYSAEMNQAYIFAKSHWITTKSTIKDAEMNSPLTRIQMAKMLSYYAVNVMWKTPDISRWIAKFDDVTSKMDKQYDNGVTLAYQLWIMWINMKNNKFRPYETVTRAEFVTALSRMIYGMNDGTWKIKYYEPHMARLYNEWIIDKADPKMKEKRGYTMIMLMRAVK